MEIKRIIVYVLFALSIVSCEEQSSVSPAPEETELLVVEAVVTNENIRHTIRLTHPFAKPNGKAIPVTGAMVAISDGLTSTTLEASDSGRYLTPQMRFVSGTAYTLIINYNGKTYTATDQSMPVESLPPLSYAKADNGYSLLLFETGSLPNYIHYEIDWSKTPSCETSCYAEIFYYDLKTVDAHEIFKPGKTDFIFPSGSTVIRRKFSMSDQYRKFLRSMLSETQWRGSVFDIQQDNAPTNLSEGAIGFFAVSTVVADTVKIP